jgi:seryl-tRNA synthetase
MIREQIDVLRDGMRRRGKLDALAPFIDRAAEVDAERRTMIQAVEERKAARNAMTQEVAKKKRAGENVDNLLVQSRNLGEEIAKLESELAVLEAELQMNMLELPNITLDDVPAGGEEANRQIRAWGEPRKAQSVKPHWEVGVSLGLIDFERGAKISGSGFIVFRGKGARLVRSLMNFMLDLHTAEHGYEEAWVPIVVNRAAMTGTSQLPKFEDDMYAIKDEELFLIPTAEVPVTNLYADEILAAADLPKGLTAYTPCFRREAGAHGKDTRGLIRVHEFDKVELVRYATPETSSDS